MSKKRDRAVKLYFTPEEYHELYTEAKELDLCVTTLIYRKALNKPLIYGLIDRE